MTDLDQLIKETEQSLKTELDNDKLILQIRDIMVQAYSEKFDTWTEESISGILLRLSTLLYGLSPKIESSRMSYNQSYGWRKFEGARRYLELKDMTVSEKTQIVEHHIQGIRQHEVYHSYLSETLKRLHDDCSRLVSVLKSVLRVKERERFTAALQT